MTRTAAGLALGVVSFALIALGGFVRQDLAGEASVSAAEPVKKPDGGGGRKTYALLVGVTKYPNLDAKFQLQGPANDVLLMEDLLAGVYKFPRENIVTLSEQRGAADPKKFPTHANIERECRRLAEVVREGDQVVVFLSGHGSQQPEDPKFPEPDGMDKTFIPRDVGTWDDGAEKVANSIAGRELGDWLRPIPTRKASL